MPDLQPGTHTLELTYDTATELGVLKAQREITIEAPIFRKLAAIYKRATRSGDHTGAAECREEVLSRRNMRVITPGEEVPIDLLNSGPQVPHEFSATVRWYPEENFLKAVVDVVDANYAAAPSEELRRRRGYVQLFVCPSGMDQDITLIHITSPSPGSRQAEVYPESIAESSDIDALWDVTPAGYTVEVKISWKNLAGYQTDWTLMPVEAMVCSKWRDWSYFIMNKPGEPRESARSYAALARN